MSSCPCAGPDAAAAYETLRRAGPLFTLIDDTHLIIRVRRCACGRAWLSIFTERVDFAGGDDPQRRELIPLEAEDIAALEPMAGRASEEALLELGDGWERRVLVRDWPGGAAQPVAAWRTGGLRIAAHD